MASDMLEAGIGGLEELAEEYESGGFNESEGNDGEGSEAEA